MENKEDSHWLSSAQDDNTRVAGVRRGYRSSGGTRKTGDSGRGGEGVTGKHGDEDSVGDRNERDGGNWGAGAQGRGVDSARRR